MILVILIALPILGGIFAWLAEYAGAGRIAARVISLMTLFIEFILVLAIWIWQAPMQGIPGGPWFLQISATWIPQWGVSFFLAMDGFSLLLVLLTVVLGIISVAASWTEIQDRVGFFHFNLLWVLAGIIGVFLALDLFLFYFFWEMMLIPMYLLIAIWGHERRIYASIKFFLFTQISGLLMLLAIIYLVILHARQTDQFTFNYFNLLGTHIGPVTAIWMTLGFFAAFAVKLPVFPLHTWLPDAHTEAPTAGSVILAGLLLKTGAYGLIRFVVPLFPDAAVNLAPAAMLLAVIGIIYGAVMAFAQTDFKRLVAYTSISHMGFVLLGVAAWNQLALQGAILQIICHGFATGALFVIAGILQERLHTRDMGLMGGFWQDAPKMGAMAMFFAMASLGLPGLGNFIGEFLVLVGAFHASILWASLAALGLIVSTIYSLWMIQRVFHGQKRSDLRLLDFNLRETVVMLVMVAVLIWLGLYPRPVINTAAPALDHLQNSVILTAHEIGRATTHD